MKLRTRITIVMVAITIFTILIGMSVMIYRTEEVSEQTAYSSVESEMQTFVYQYNNIELKNANNIVGGTEYTVAKYAIMKLNRFRNEGSEYVIQSADEDIYNNSGINPKMTIDKYGIKYESADDRILYDRVIIKWQGKYYCIVGDTFNYGGEERYMSVVRDITDSMEQIVYLTYFCIAVSIIIIIIAATGTYFFLKWQLAPLGRLEAEADSIANRYSDSESLPVHGKREDEIQSLSRSFHQMQSIVDGYIEKVETKAKEQKMLLSAMAHEMRTPITAITGYSYMLKNVALQDGQRDEAIAFIDDESRRLERLSTKLTELITIENKKVQIDDIDMGIWKKQIERILLDKARRKEISYSICVKEDSCANIRGDADLLTELIVNLFDNACKAKSTQIDVEIADDCIRVKDNGCGIEKDEIEKITQPFYQGDKSRKSEGFGIGLTLCLMIAKAHNAQIYIESEPEKGSTVTVDFTNPLHFDDDSKMSDTI